MGKFLSDKYAGLTAYVPGEQPKDRKYIKLNTNESPFPPAPGVGAALASCAGDLNLYPDPEYSSLRAKIAEYHGVPADCVTVGDGSDEVLDFIFRAFFTGKKILFPDVTYGFYKVFADLYGIGFREVPLREDFTVDPADYSGAEGIVIADPNAPTGVQLGRDGVLSLLAGGGLVVVDEAYADFARESSVGLVKEFDNLIVVRTFSKSRSLAGARVGYCVAQPGIIRDIELIRFSTNPYNLSRMAVAAAEASLADDGYFKKCVREVVRVRGKLIAGLRALGFEATDSEANFVFARHPGTDGGALAAALRERGILIRRFAGERTGDHLRITVGGEADTDVLLATLSGIVGK